jgi:hypothetical protein
VEFSQAVFGLVVASGLAGEAVDETAERLADEKVVGVDGENMRMGLFLDGPLIDPVRND